MDRYIKGLLTAYDRILNLISSIDPDSRDLSLECLKSRILASLYAYELFTAKEDLDEFESELDNKRKALEGSLRISDIDEIIEKLRQSETESNCKILIPPSDYFRPKSM